MQKAAELLTTTAASISQISEELGFDDVKYFSRKFKKQYGVSPASYRKINRNDNN
jgi:two-component system response regulator YesN